MWLIQVEIYKYLSSLANTEEADKAEWIQLHVQKIIGTIIRCDTSLIVTTIATGIVATIIHPSLELGILLGKYLIFASAAFVCSSRKKAHSQPYQPT
ncbi:hypothetical protein FRX31_020952 [Thalictrum thalictroides]|uniref:Uncharacterized protein n=1 Tax=Thalictrum thalictroides TaxID=46969 RepID=A0A7J6VWH5_THATH|nr:hypothetical protein FRX31_020952 [Thalictrum thalictroides]